MESLMHYCWKHRILPLGELHTTDGRRVEIIDPGMLNRDAGPDFFNAKMKIDGEMWVGNVEMHIDAQDWYRHGHDKDAAYNNVVLHVVTKPSSDNQPTLMGIEGKVIPELVIEIPEGIKANYKELLSTDNYPPCYKVIPSIPSLKVHSWMARLQTERLQQKTEAIEQRLQLLNGDWEHAYFVTLARSYGFGSNSDVLEQWAAGMPLRAVDHHRDDLFQVEALFFGQAGLLNIGAVRERMKLETAADEYFQRLSNEHNYLRHKFSLDDITPRNCAQAWKFMRMRPQNFPHIRIAQLARLYHEGRASLSQLLECKDLDQLRKLMRCGVSEYWENHYTFGHESTHSTKQLSMASINLLMINCAIPMLFAFGRHNGNESLCERAFDLLEQLKPENNNITRMWQEVGLDVRSAGDSQALIQLKKQYCDRKDCLRCRFGYEYLK